MPIVLGPWVLNVLRRPGSSANTTSPEEDRPLELNAMQDVRESPLVPGDSPPHTPYVVFGNPTLSGVSNMVTDSWKNWAGSMEKCSVGRGTLLNPECSTHP
jgi:hypothetical protein